MESSISYRKRNVEEKIGKDNHSLKNPTVSI